VNEEFYHRSCWLRACCQGILQRRQCIRWYVMRFILLSVQARTEISPTLSTYYYGCIVGDYGLYIYESPPNFSADLLISAYSCTCS
jgi:hypothetical protein